MKDKQSCRAFLMRDLPKNTVSFVAIAVFHSENCGILLQVKNQILNESIDKSEQTGSNETVFQPILISILV